MLARLFRKKSVKLAARSLYDQLSAAARDPNLYGLGKVADTPDGRFELLALHSAVLFARLSKRGEQADETSQEIFDIMFSAMDHALRELGVGDISIGKRIRKLAESFYGRLAVYHEAMTGGAETQPALVCAIATHVLETQETDHPFAIALAQRVTQWTRLLAEQPDMDLLAGNLVGPNELVLQA
jgi:cytochrome b pre-mRNA-processing protein 3